MRYLLDTCIVSDGARRDRYPALAQWLDAQDPAHLAISALTIGELRFGIQRLPAGRRREQLKQWLDNDLAANMAGRILPVDAAIADHWGQLRAAGDDAGRPLPAIDGLLLATAHVHGLTFVTHDLADTDNRGVPVLSPY